MPWSDSLKKLSPITSWRNHPYFWRVEKLNFFPEQERYCTNQAYPALYSPFFGQRFMLPNKWISPLNIPCMVAQCMCYMLFHQDKLGMDYHQVKPAHITISILRSAGVIRLYFWSLKSSHSYYTCINHNYPV